MRVFSVATIHVLVPCPEGYEAADYISETLRTAFPDWAYVKLGGQYLYATEKLVADADQYEEGSFIE